jgi:hypothetical protein
MSGNQTHAGWAVRIARWAGFGRNPMRRRIDRIQAIVRAGFLVAFLAGAPLAAFSVSHAVYAAGLRTAWAEAATYRRVPATVLRSVPMATQRWHPAWPLVTLTVRWHAAGGRYRTGAVSWRGSPAPGSTVHVWVDASGGLAHRPLTHAEVAGKAAGAAVATPVVLGLVLVIGSSIASLLFDRCRLASWEAEWLVVEPHWTGRR